MGDAGEPQWWHGLSLVRNDACLAIDSAQQIVGANAAAGVLLGSTVNQLVGARAATVLGLGGSDLLTEDRAAGPIRRPVPGAEAGLMATAQPVPGGWFLVMRDLTDLQPGSTGDYDRLDADRSALLAVMDQVLPGDDLRQTVSTLCTALERINWIDGAMIFLLPGSGDLVNVTADMPEELKMDFGRVFTMARMEGVIAATERGPWYLDLTQSAPREFVDETLLDAMRSIGIRASAYAALKTDGTTFGILSVASFDDDAATLLAGRLGSLQDLARLSAAILRNQAKTYARAERLRAEVASTLDRHAFRPVFQPIVALHDSALVGYEALTRFDDGRNPETHFAEATEIGMEVELEEACAQAALDAARRLPAGVSVGLNFSPRAVLDGVLGRLGNSGRPLVVEVTEHTRTSDYALLRAALARTPNVQLAVDDAGAGYASLRHVLELQPQFVKLDIGLIRDVDHDPARAAMVAGMRHFAQATGTRLVAEGVERREQAAALQALGVALAQGYLFGRPAPLS